jgi:integrase/recombinase XerC/integrase/recombinase XerD
VENFQKPYWFSQTVMPPAAGEKRRAGRPPKVAPLPVARPASSPAAADGDVVADRVQPLRGLHPLKALLREWLLELKVMGRSGRTIKWYQQKMDWYFRSGGVENLEQLTAFELKRFLGDQQERGLSDNTIHGFFQVIRSFANWCVREEYPVDRSVLRVRPPKVALKEMATYTEDQVAAIFGVAKVGWPQLAVQILLGTGIRVGELCSLALEDVEDDEDAMFLKIKRGKGAKFRRVPVSQRLRREIIRYVNKRRPDTKVPNLLVLTSGRPVSVQAACNLLQRLRQKLGFPLHAHRFRHTFATEYLRRGGEMERLRRILGHTTYSMVMRYVHLDKGDLGRDFDERSPF